ncbi:hypothetical protein BpHYR1_040070 [Brachionus plicatilis]|uniref:Uncharacterized protein n=1 Tax=Brachionus plicatilis TaxID=10195 RepID=A0A3M7RZD3_BRAPC|nr:hypothetical protein BpHYR1_040070 [Brachionus plicatilis]
MQYTNFNICVSGLRLDKLENKNTNLSTIILIIEFFSNKKITRVEIKYWIFKQIQNWAENYHV